VLTCLTRRPLPFIVAAVLIAVTGVAAWVGFSRDHDRAVQQQEETAEQTTHAVQTLVGGLEYRVGSLRGLFAASGSVSQREFEIFTRPLLGGQRASALAWVTMVPGSRRAAFEDRHGYEIRRMRGLQFLRSPDAAQYAVLTHIVPGSVRVGLGVDANSFPGQMDAMRRAIATGRTQATPPVPMPGSGDPSLILYAPAYRAGAPLHDPAERRAALIGFGLGVFRFADLRAALAHSIPAGTGVTIATSGRPVVRAGDMGAGATIRRIDIAGQDWTVTVHAAGRGGIGLGWLVVIVGSIVTVLLTLFTAQAVRSEAAARELAAARERERDAVESAQQLMLEKLDELFVVRWDHDLRVVTAGGGLLVVKGYDPESLVGETVHELTDGPQDRPLIEILERAAAGEEATTDFRDERSGRTLWLRALPVEDGVLLVGLDVTARAEAEHARRSAEERFRRSFEDAPVGMALLDGDGRYVEANDALGAILGVAAKDLAGRRLADSTHPEDVEAEGAQLAALLDGRAVRSSYEKRAVHADGHALWVAVHTTELGAADGAERLFLVQILDISDQRRFEEQLQHLADHDPLTGLENRRAFERAVDAHLAHVRRYGDEGALLILDLDHFKAVNDTLGHHAGDALIMAVADVLRAQVRDSDRVARLGGDEFAVLLPKADEEQARAVAAKLVAAVRDERRVLGGRAWTTTVSVGVALFSAAVERGEQMLVDADLAMYDAKEAGRDRFGVYRAGDRAESRTQARLAWMDRIRGALEEDRLALLAQPILDLASGEVVHHELLLRMVSPEGDLIPPGAFLSIAERFGLVTEIDDWVVRHAIQALADHPDRDLVLEVNLSGSSIGSPELLETIETELARTGVNACSLIFEVTETAAVSNIPRARAFADRLAALGCRFALDDFGAGFGSFYYLKHLPFDFLKIDGEFVRHCAASHVDQVIISSLVHVAGGLGKRTIAEYVDEQPTIDALRRLGVDLAQGYGIGVPKPLEEWLAVTYR
jgi:diguanylate cyclase (GGDEF)-like protein/PAS domain S-box-containing protein